MGLSIAAFVPEGIVIASDGLVEIRNNERDHCFLHKKQTRLFIFQDKYMINIHECGYLKGLPCAFYVNKVFAKLVNSTISTIKDFANAFNNEMSSIISEELYLSFYVAGMERNAESNQCTPVLLLWDKGQVSIINREVNKKIVYNFHSIGHGMWLNKLLLPTSFVMETGERIDFDQVDIDFSKYSIEDAIHFSKELLTISRKMDNIVQLKQMVGEFLTFGILTLEGKLTIIKDLEGWSQLDY